jgi:copper transport protein
VIIGLVLSLAATTASAHNTFTGSSPAEGEVVGASPSQWSVSFASDVPIESASGEIIRSDGSRTPLPTPIHGDSAKTIVFPLPGDLSGRMTARWRLVGTDGHVISGRVNFVVSRTGDASAPAASPSDESSSGSTTSSDDDSGSSGLPGPVQGVVRALGYLSLLAVGGLLLMDRLTAAGAISGPVATKTLAYGSAVMVVAPAVQTVQLAADVTSSGFVSAILRVGDALALLPGQMSGVRTLFGVVIAGTVISITRGVRAANSGALLATAGLGYLISLAYSGHSRSQGSPWLGVPVDVAHTAAVVYWLGGLAALLLVVAPRLGVHDAVAAYRRFGHGARIAVPVIIATGVVQTARLHGGVTTLFTTGHGRLMIVKLALVAVMLRYADRNRRLLARSPMTVSDLRLRRDLTVTALAETGVGLGVIAVTAVLVTSSLT